MPTNTYTASMITRKANSTLNTKETAASQEYYTDDYNFVGVICFSGMNLANRSISAIRFTMTSAAAGLGISHTKTVYIRESNYQNTTQAVKGSAFVGETLGTFTGAFYNNTVTMDISGDLLEKLAAYFASGKNTFCLYNPSPEKSSHSYSTNYLQWNSLSMTVTYTDAVSIPTVSSSSVDMGIPVTISTNRLSEAATHSLSFEFCGISDLIAENVGASYEWTPPLYLASLIPNASSGICTLICETYAGGRKTGSKSVPLTLTVPASVIPAINEIATVEASNTTYGVYLKGQSRLSVNVSASGACGSSVTSYRTVIDGTAYNGQSFTTGVLNHAGTLSISSTVTDSRGRTGTKTVSLSVEDYSPPSLTAFTAERCNAAGTEKQLDGNHVRISVSGNIAPVNDRNTVTCKVYYRLASNESWIEALTVSSADYTLEITDLLLDSVFDTLSSYDLKIYLADIFYYVEQVVSIGTKQVIIDFYRDGNGIAFGKVAETAHAVEFGWPVILSSALGVDQGGTGADSADGACENIGALKKSGDTMTGNLRIETGLYPSVILKPTDGDSPKRTVFEGSYLGASSFSSYDDDANRRMLEVRSAANEPSLDNAAMVRSCVNNTWNNYRVFHEGMETAVPVSKGGTGATTAETARSNLGTGNADNIITGTLARERLPFKFSCGSGTVSGSSSFTIDYSGAGFTKVPKVVVSYSTTGSNWSGDNGALKIHSKTTTGATVIVGGSFSTKRDIDWFAIGS